MNNITHLLEKIEQTKTLDFGDIFSASIELFKKTWLQGFILFLLMLVIILPFIIAVYLPLIGMVFAQEQVVGFSEDIFNGFLGDFSILYILIVVVGVFVFGAICFAINAGFYRVMRKLDINENVETKDFFYFVKMKYLGKGLVIMLFSMLLSIFSMFLCYIPFIYAIVPLSFLIVIFAFNPDLSVNDIIKVSFKLANKYWLISFGLIVISSMLSQIVGYMACGVGLLFTSTFMYHPVYLIYKKVIGFSEIDAIDEIGTSVE